MPAELHGMAAGWSRLGIMAAADNNAGTRTRSPARRPRRQRPKPVPTATRLARNLVVTWVVGHHGNRDKLRLKCGLHSPTGPHGWFFTSRREPDFSSALTNPPGGRHHDLESEKTPLLRLLRQRLSKAEHGQVFPRSLCRRTAKKMEEFAFGS
jgi:hypothetical protein